VVLDAGAVQAAARRAGLDWANSGGLRRISVRAGAPVAESAKGNVEVLTYARNINAGETVQAEDLTWAKVAGAPADAPADATALTGLVARKPLRSGAVASTRDVTAPQVIKNGDMVNVVYSDGAISVSLTGKAMASAVLGDQVAIQNPSSKKVISAIATGPGEAMVGPGANRFRANRQYAAR
jgi:flagella basal body P-ring formation protein FlgA